MDETLARVAPVRSWPTRCGAALRVAARRVADLLVTYGRYAGGDPQISWWMLHNGPRAGQEPLAGDRADGWPQ